MNIKQQLLKINPLKLKAKNGKTFAEILEEETIRLRDCIQNRLDEYMSNNLPSMYSRTGNLQSSISIDDIMKIKNNGSVISIEASCVYFNESGYHWSGDGIIGWDGNGERVNTAYLLNYGYEVNENVWFREIENFGFRQGGNFVEKGVMDFLEHNPYNLRIKIVTPENGYKV